jgi:hypothetical protein
VRSCRTRASCSGIPGGSGDAQQVTRLGARSPTTGHLDILVTAQVLRTGPVGR